MILCIGEISQLDQNGREVAAPESRQRGLVNAACFNPCRFQALLYMTGKPHAVPALRIDAFALEFLLRSHDQGGSIDRHIPGGLGMKDKQSIDLLFQSRLQPLSRRNRVIAITAEIDRNPQPHFGNFSQLPSGRECHLFFLDPVETDGAGIKAAMAGVERKGPKPGRVGGRRLPAQQHGEQPVQSPRLLLFNLLARGQIAIVDRGADQVGQMTGDKLFRHPQAIVDKPRLAVQGAIASINLHELAARGDNDAAARTIETVNVLDTVPFAAAVHRRENILDGHEKGLILPVDLINDLGRLPFRRQFHYSLRYGAGQNRKKKQQDQLDIPHTPLLHLICNGMRAFPCRERAFADQSTILYIKVRRGVNLRPATQLFLGLGID